MPSRRGAAILLMLGASFLLAAMGLAVKLASAHYSAGEIACYRGLLGTLLVAAMMRHAGVGMRSPRPWSQFLRGLTGAVSTVCFFYALGQLPLGTAVTLNYTSSVWIALFVLSGLAAGARSGDGRDPALALAVLCGFGGMALVLQPTVAAQQLAAGLVGLAGGMLAGWAHLQVAALGRAGEPALRTVFYFSIGNAAAGAAAMAAGPPPSAHSAAGIGLVAALTLCATAAQIMLTRAYAIGTPMVNASLQYLSIAWAFGFGLLLFGDHVGPASAMGVAIIVAAGIAASAPQRRRQPARSS